jgi:hypothetical protein
MANRVAAASSAMPAVAEATRRTTDLAQFETSLRTVAQAQNSSQGQGPPLQINVQVDGETVARAVHGADRDVAARSFSPVPAY